MTRIACFLRQNRRIFVLTGAGVSTASGIPDYRDAEGNWKHRRPVSYGDFMRHDRIRRRYWARSLLGWERFSRARPNAAHRALARLETDGRIHHLVTQNVDGLHQRAGSRRVIDLHGRLDEVQCMSCDERLPRAGMQTVLEDANPSFRGLHALAAPDGDAALEDVDYDDFRVPGCSRCGGTLKPSVVFFGETVPKDRVEASFRMLAESDAVLVVGSSLMVWSGYRFCHSAAREGKPIAAINIGRTRADASIAVKVDGDCGRVLTDLLDCLA